MADAEDDERSEELATISAIFPELSIDPNDPFTASIDLDVCPERPLRIRFSAQPQDGREGPGSNGDQHSTDILSFPRLPPIHLQMTLPEGYPLHEPPVVKLSTTPAWLPSEILQGLQDKASSIWEDLGCVQVIFDYIDHLEEQAATGFESFMNEDDPLLDVDCNLKISLLDFSSRAEKAYFDKQTFDCGVCLEPKKGTLCYQMERCKHIFCIECLQDFYSSCITEGDVSKVQCMAPNCQILDGRGKKIRPTIAPPELLQIPLDEKLVQRYADLKRKKKLEADKSTIYCPRSWCQAPARSKKYPKITDLSAMVDLDDGPELLEPPPETETDPDPKVEVKEDRLAICENEKCGFAFCRVCKAGWHGDFVRCGRRDAAELSVEEQASFDYIRLNTSQCPGCFGPSVKSMGCNHMTCFQCRTHYCYLCSAWLDPSNPYRHFNQEGKPCYHRLWVLEAGDNGGGEVRFEGARALEAALAAVALEDAENAAP
jgi:E3 ubiquitin-protein ligase RNF14